MPSEGSGMKAVMFPPWFLTRTVLKEIQKLVPPDYHRRFRAYFDHYGCVRCEKTDVLYGCNGLCLACVGLISDRMKSLKRKQREKPIPVQENVRWDLRRRRELARDLLADFRRNTGRKRLKL
jgi:hypothetical protein